MIRSLSLSLRCTLPQAAISVFENLKQQTRSKHSKTQVKRLFNRNPAVYRMRMKQQEQFQTLNPKKEEQHQPLEPRFPQVFRPVFISNGWSKPPSRDPANKDFIDISVYPFQVARTANKPSNTAGFLPVYTDFR